MRVLADLILLLHGLIVLFVVGGLVAVLAGNLRSWQWVNDIRFRLLHLASIAFVAAQAWCCQTCPLTTLESWLRQRSGGAGYESSFIEHWLHRLLFYTAPEWMFTLAYTAFGLLVALAWWRFPPK